MMTSKRSIEREIAMNHLRNTSGGREIMNEFHWRVRRLRRIIASMWTIFVIIIAAETWVCVWLMTSGLHKTEITYTNTTCGSSEAKKKLIYDRITY